MHILKSFVTKFITLSNIMMYEILLKEWWNTGLWLLKLCSVISPLWIHLILDDYPLHSLNHIHIWQVSLQLGCSDTCQIWMRYLICQQFLWRFWENGKIMEWRKLAKSPPPRSWLGTPKLWSVSSEASYGLSLQRQVMVCLLCFEGS